jgi:predicted PolB exonuclease-like 3'-5' exonuclease
MYADDVILLSETSEGLQNCLEKLHKYCEVWGLQVNIKKTKSMIFNNTGRLDPIKFTYNKNIVENVRKYSYLGVVFSNSGSFTKAKKELYQKGLKAYFKFRK